MLNKYINIFKNFEVNNNSFIGQLDKFSDFDIKLFNLLIYDIYLFAKNEPKASISNDFLLKVFRIYNHVFTCIFAHFNNNDLFVIKNWNNDYNIYLERFGFIIECLLKKDSQSIEEYEDELGSLLPNSADNVMNLRNLKKKLLKNLDI